MASEPYHFHPLQVPKGRNSPNIFLKKADLHYIHDLLGHESSRTMEVYTHITSKYLKKNKKPIGWYEIVIPFLFT